MAQATWMKVAVSFSRSKKASQSADALGISRQQFAGHMLDLWSWAVECADNGYLDGLNPATVAEASGWKRAAGKWVEVLYKFEWVDDDHRLHEWELWAGAAGVSREKDRDRKRKVRGQSSELPRNVHEMSAPRVDKSRERENPSSATRVSDEAEDLAHLLASLIESNGSKKPSVTTAWLTAADRLLRLDGRDPEEAAHILRWCQADDFWRGNILSMTKFREKYDQLRLKAGTIPKSTPLLKPLDGGEW